MRWSVEKRLEFIEFRLFWEESVNRSDIIDQFSVSVPQASKDLALYEEKAPGNLHYDKSAKRYRASDDFNPAFFKPNADSYLAQLSATTGNKIGEFAAWLTSTPEYDELPIPHRRVDAAVLRDILKAVREIKSLEVFYQSMSANKPSPEWRRITPHAFGYDGLRWHVRAFCHIDKKFKDFILSRCTMTRKLAHPGASTGDDLLWHNRFTVKLAPNPALNESQQSIIAQDYEMTSGRVEVMVRKALLYYFLKRLRLDVAEKLDNPREIPLVVANRAAFDVALAEATA